ncbi:spore cortex formation protein SpoVR/YcgB (stage V sporulation) [Paenibacillus endophyticus]|uniref:Spore cortex formation protein SpoVR/YcgB (Stage V sporulation) n=1 Tax=Paenibacillus endophyticus TaxID=1294268 RepID=A0A7W5C5P2_9BACL|nr:spore cortex formation protein SpoVR/YcgB (stage V sporulation) [Paenibacillus endophyticus]
MDGPLYSKKIINTITVNVDYFPTLLDWQRDILTILNYEASYRQ